MLLLLYNEFNIFDRDAKFEAAVLPNEIRPHLSFGGNIWKKQNKKQVMNFIGFLLSRSLNQLEFKISQFYD